MSLLILMPEMCGCGELPGSIRGAALTEVSDMVPGILSETHSASIGELGSVPFIVLTLMMSLEFFFYLFALEEEAI